MEQAEISNKRLKIGFITIAVGLVVGFFESTSAAVDTAVQSGAYSSCITYGNSNCDRYQHSSSGFGWWIAFIGFWIVMGHLTGKAAAERGRRYDSFFWLGFFLPVIGLIYVSTLTNKDPQKVEVVQSVEATGETRLCPFCAETIQKAALICKHCKSPVEGK